MIYLKCVLSGTVLLIACLALFTFILFTIHKDLRAIMGLFPFISVTASFRCLRDRILVAASEGFAAPRATSALRHALGTSALV